MSKRMTFLTCLACLGVISVGFAGPEDGDPVDFSIGLKVAVTDNRDSSAVDEQENTDIFVTPRVDVYVDSEGTVWGMFYAPSFRYRSDPSDVQNEDELFHDLGFNLDHELSESTEFRIRERFELTDDPSVSEGGFTVRNDRSFIRNDITFGVQHDVSDITYVDVSVENELKRFDDSDVADESDEDEFGGQAKIWKKVSHTMGVQARVFARQYEFENPGGIVRDFDTVVGAVGVEKVLNPELRGGVDVGVTLVEYDDIGLDSESFPYVHVNARFAPNPGFRVTGSVTHGVRDSDVFPFATQEYTEFRGELEADASAMLALGAGLVFRQSEYDEDDLPSTAPSVGNGDEDTLVGSAKGTWELTDTSRLVVQFVFEDVDSDVDDSFTKNTGSVALFVDI
jgi:hypothetical protein